LIASDKKLDPNGRQVDLVGWILDEAILPNARIRQGDLIRFHNASDPLRAAGIVVTADCDLENKKHARLLTLAPVVSGITIVEHYLIPEDCERKRDLIESYVFREYLIDEKQDFETKIAFLREAASSKGDDVIFPARVASNFLLNELEPMSTNSYKMLMKAIGIEPKKLDTFKKQIRSRGDLLVLPEANGFGVEGGIAWVRHIWQVPMSDIALRTSELANRSGERVARLDSPYRYRLTQLIAQVFSDIGLPNFSDSVDKLLEEAFK